MDWLDGLARWLLTLTVREWSARRRWTLFCLVVLCCGFDDCTGCDANNYREHIEDRDAGLSRDRQKECTDGARAVLAGCRDGCYGSRTGKECTDTCDEQYSERKRDCKRL